MTARRMLFGAGGPRFTPPIPTPFAIGPEGSFGWNDLHSLAAAAQYYNGRTYWTYLKDDGHVAVRYWDHATLTASPEKDLGFIEADLHAAPVLLVRDSDKRIMIWYCAHNGTSLFQVISTNPEDISAFGSATNLSGSIGSGLFTYVTAHQLTGEASDPIYLFFRSDMNGTATWSYAVSSNGGSTWGAMTDIWTIAGDRAYLTVFKTSPTRIDVAASDRAHGVEFNASLYHFYWSAGAWHETDGTVITGPPFNASDATLVHDGSGGNEGVLAGGIGLDGANPVIVYRRWEGYTTDQRYRWARWDGAAWDDQELVASGATNGGGMVTLDPANPSQVWLVKIVSGIQEIMYWVTTDDGATWDETQLTTSPEANFLPIPVRDADSSLRVLWAYGDGTGGGNWGVATPIGWGS